MYAEDMSNVCGIRDVHMVIAGWARVTLHVLSARSTMLPMMGVLVSGGAYLHDERTTTYAVNPRCRDNYQHGIPLEQISRESPRQEVVQMGEDSGKNFSKSATNKAYKTQPEKWNIF